MFSKHEHFKEFEIDDSSTVWRYMTTTKFLNLIQSQALNFVRADVFEDKWEGKLSKANWDNHASTYGEVADAMFFPKAQFEGRLSSLIHVSSWSVLDHESTAMWNEYGDSFRGIAIQTSWGELSENLKNTEPTYGFRVQYRDYASDWVPEGNLYYPIIHKRHFFSHESEARIFFDSSLAELTDQDDGTKKLTARPNHESIQVPLDLEKLKFSVMLGAKMPIWEKDLVKNSLLKKWARVTVQDSALSELPTMRI